jgi:hypothetical protein
MKEFSRVFSRLWIMIPATVILIAAHGLALYFLRRLALTTMVVTGIAVLVAAKHVGVFGSLYGMFRKRFQKTRPSQQ